MEDPSTKSSHYFLPQQQRLTQTPIQMPQFNVTLTRIISDFGVNYASEERYYGLCYALSQLTEPNESAQFDNRPLGKGLGPWNIVALELEPTCGVYKITNLESGKERILFINVITDLEIQYGIDSSERQTSVFMYLKNQYSL